MYEYIIIATDQMHNVTQTPLLHLSFPLQAIDFIQEILTLSV